jgi:hypothetical protein
MVITPNPNVSAELLKRKVLLGLPWYKSASPITTMCITNLVDKRRTSTLLNFSDAFIVHTRNTVADHFLKSDCEFLLTIDDDMVVPFGRSDFHRAYLGWNIPDPFASFHTIDRLLSHNKTLVGGLYFGRAMNGKGKPMYVEGMNNPKEAEYARSGPHNVIKPTNGIGTGCLLIHRTVFEDIEKKFPNLARQPDGTKGNWFTSSEHTLMRDVQRTIKMLGEGPMTGEKCYAAMKMLTQAELDARNTSGLGVGEDIMFCRRAAQAGHQCYVDMGLWCGHVGATVYDGKNTRPS